MKRKTEVSSQPMRVYICGYVNHATPCGFEHWDGYELIKHYLDAHGLKIKAILVNMSKMKRQNSEIWRLSKHK